MNKKNVFIFPLLLAVLWTGAACAFDKVGTTSFQFLKVMPSARGTALGEAFSAATNNSDAVYFNPAALTRIKKMDLAVDYMDYFLDVTHYSLAAAWTIPNLGTVAVHAIMTDVGEIRVTSVDALDFVDGVYLGYTGETIHPGSQVFGLSFARDLTDKFSFGVTSKYGREDLGIKSTGNFMFDAGLTYDTGFKTLKVAAVVRHFGPEVKFYDNVNLRRYDASSDSSYYKRYTGKSYPLPQTFNIGLAAYLLAPDANALFHAGNQTLLFAADMVQPRDYDQQYNIGIEYGYHDLLFLRGGYKLNYDTEGISLGFGLAWNKLRIDYAYSDFGDYLDTVHRFSFGFVLD